MAFLKAALLFVCLCVLETHALHRYSWRFTPLTRDESSGGSRRYDYNRNHVGGLREFQRGPVHEVRIEQVGTDDVDSRRYENNRIEPNHLGRWSELESGPEHEVREEQVGSEEVDNNEIEDSQDIGTGHVKVTAEKPRPGCERKVARLCPEKFEAYDDPYCSWTMVYETSFNCCPYNRVLMCQ